MSSHVYGESHNASALRNVIKPAETTPQWVTIYGADGQSVQTYAIDARTAVENFPEMWAYGPWPAKRAKS